MDGYTKSGWLDAVHKLEHADHPEIMIEKYFSFD